MDNREVVVPTQEIQHLPYQRGLVVLPVGPKGVPGLGTVIDDEHAHHAPEGSPFRPLDVEIDGDRAGRQEGRLQYVSLLVPDGRRLEGEVMRLPQALCPLASLAETKGARELGDRENALSV